MSKILNCISGRLEKCRDLRGEIMKRYFQSSDMQNMYKSLKKSGMHHWAAIRKVIRVYEECGYDVI